MQNVFTTSCRTAHRIGKQASPSPCNRHRQSALSLAISKAYLKSGTFPNYPASSVLQPCPTPARSIDVLDTEGATSIRTGIPQLPALPFQRAMPITPVNQQGEHVDCFPGCAAFPAIRPGRRSHRNFRSVLRLHSRYGPLDCSATYSDLCHEASIRPIARPNRSSATKPIDNSLVLPPLVIRAIGAHRMDEHLPVPCQERSTSALSTTGSVRGARG